MKVFIIFREQANSCYIWLRASLKEIEFPDNNFYDLGWHRLPIDKQSITLIKIDTKFREQPPSSSSMKDILSQYYIAEISDEQLLTCDSKTVRRWTAKLLEIV